MKQVKILDSNVTDDLETKVNEFLNENKGKIKVCDIKFTSSYDGRWDKIFVMVIYETIE